MGYVLDTTEVPKPKGSDEKHVFEVTLAFIAPADWSVQDVWTLAAMAIAKSGLDVVAGLNAEVKNLTMIQRDTSESAKGHGMLLTGFKNKAITKALQVLPVFRVKKTRVRKKKG